MDMKRIADEQAALSSIAAALRTDSAACAAAVDMPRVIAYDSENYNLLMSDCGTRTKDLHTAFPSLSPAQRVDVGRRLGLWLAALHHCPATDRAAFSDEEGTDRQGLDQRIDLLSAGLPAALAENSTAEQVAAEKAAFVALMEPFIVAVHKDRTGRVIHGDFWPGNILVGPGVETDDAKTFVAVIDWEGVGLGSGAMDLGTFAAEAWLLCHFHSVSARASVIEEEDFGMLNAFLASYLEVVGTVEEEFLK